MGNSKKISVIIPFYNSKNFIIRALRSVIKQSYRNIEIILVNDKSTDGSYELVKKYKKIDSRIKIISTKKNSRTVSKPRNLGIKISSGEYIAFLDADDWWHEKKLEVQMKSIGKNLLCCTACNYFYVKQNKKSGFLINNLRLIIQLFYLKRLINKNTFGYIFITL